MTKVLICMPFHEIKYYALDYWIKAINQIREYTPNNSNISKVDILLIDNSPPDREVSALTKEKCEANNIDYIWLSFPPNLPAPVHERIKVSMNYARDKVLSQNYNYMFILETDVLPSKNALVLMHKYMNDKELDAVQASYYAGYTPKRFVEEGFWLTGIALIKKKVLEVIPFRYDMEWLNGCPDAFLKFDMDEKEFKTGFHPSVSCLHMEEPSQPNRGWRNLQENLYK